jgi:hypothetical protein
MVANDYRYPEPAGTPAPVIGAFPSVTHCFVEESYSPA